MNFFKKITFLLVPLALSGTIFLVNPTTSFAQQESSPSATPTTTPTSTDHDYFASGNNPIFTGTVNNADAYIIGGTSDVDGTVNGDLLVVSGQTNIRGTVSQNVRVVGGNVNISGTIGRNLSIVGGNVTIANNAKINGSVAAAAGNLNILGPIGKDLTATGGNIEIANVINGNTNINAQKLILASTAKIGGDLVYTSKNTAQIDPQAQVLGTIHQATPSQDNMADNVSRQIGRTAVGFYVLYQILNNLALLLIGALLISLLPIFTTGIIGIITTSPWKSLGIGIVASIVLPILIFLLFITIIGIPFALILLVLLVIFYFIGKIFVAIAIGQWILSFRKRRYNLIWALVVGLIILFLLSLISPLNLLVSAIVGSLGLGAVLIGINEYYRTLKNKKIL